VTAGSRVVFGENVRRLRTAAGLTQQQLAGKLGYADASTPGQIERGRHSASLDIVDRYAAALGVTPAELLTPERPS
jgi:transcriptional regulator with XRE-family HTH domain